ncbi:DUF1513 domain-containing protein [Roseibium sp. MMSF_3412]|uniref:DUF1513 domain-containing protein n=1 Tax=Roseibium sp. MMSF_3412 TaxID=3046712 RepID=UPI00273CF569|nr:DUF1513 domain-containing protein [Roseibium sp. MMSF_3412]
MGLTAISRRGFLTALGGWAAAPAFSGSTLAASLLEKTAGDDARLFASAYKLADGSFGIGLLDDYGQVLARITLPGRGHGIAVSPDRRRFVAFARRPGTFALLVRPFEDREPLVLVAEPGRHFYGHGCYSADGRLLYAVENDFEAVRGVVGVYDVSGELVRRIGEFPTHGIGPHDIALSADGTMLVIANGGIETHPDRAREKLNLETMQPSVVFVDAESGDLVVRHQLDGSLHQLSLRHMALDQKGRAWVGGQYEGAASDAPPLVAVFTQDDVPKLTEIPAHLAGKLENYIGSVAANSTGDVIATSAPRGGHTLFWNAVSGDFLGAQSIPDGCGVAPADQGSFLISDGNGGVSYVLEPGASSEVLSRPPGFAWDNHLVAIS